jgi:hypothetical protein
LPVLHYLFFSVDAGFGAGPGAFRYISAAGNYFAGSVPLQAGLWLVVGLAALGITRLRRRLGSGRRTLAA